MEDSLMRKALRLGSSMVPYMDWVLPIVERALGVSGNDTAALQATVLKAMEQSGKEWKAQLRQLQAAQQEVIPALADQQRRLERLEHRSVEMADALTSIADNQAQMTRQVDTLAKWVRVAAFAGIIFGLFLAGAAIFFLRHKMGHSA